jgi:hypothetical protein
MESTKPTAPSITVAAPPRPLSRSTVPETTAVVPGWRLTVSTIRTASPPSEVGKTCPAVYATRYARVSQGTRSRMEWASSSQPQRSARTGTVPSMMATASTNQAMLASARMSTVVPKSIFETM